jgi:hypothetical protein
MVIYEAAFTNRDLTAIPFALSSKGDEVVLSAWTNGQLTGWRAQVSFGAAENGVSFGRYVTSVGKEEFVAMKTHTFGMDDPGSVEQFCAGAGLPNAYPKVGPVVISEIMFHPPDLGTNDNQRDEFIELHNLSTVPVSLFDPAYPSNTWRLRDGVDFDFPPNTILPAGGYLVVASFNPDLDPTVLAAFRATYALGTNVTVLGPYNGKLDNGGEAIELKKPDAPNAGEAPYILVERIEYADRLPWPAGADGTGLSLRRADDSLFGDDPVNWTAAWPSPASAEPANPDFDNDGLPNDWEVAHGFAPNNPGDAQQDADQDGLTNLEEYWAGTNPTDAASVLKLAVGNGGLAGGTNLVIRFEGVATKTYGLESTGDLTTNWTNLSHIGPLPTSGTLWITNPVPPGTAQRFFRLVIP